MIFLIKITFMEIKEIVSYYLNSDSNILDVTFRTIEDSDDILRNDNIDYSIVDDYGYKLESDSFDFFDDDEFDDSFSDEKIQIISKYEKYIKYCKSNKVKINYEQYLNVLKYNNEKNKPLPPSYSSVVKNIC